MPKVVDKQRCRQVLYPSYARRVYTSRKLAVCKEDYLVDEDGVTYRFTSWEEYKQIVLVENFLVFVRKLIEFIYLEQLIRDGTAICTEGGNPTCGWFRGTATNDKGRRVSTTRWLVSADMWGERAITPEFLSGMQRLYTHCEVGTPPTKSSLANSIFEKVFVEKYGMDWKKHRHARPTRGTAWQFEYKYQKGAIIETYVNDGWFEPVVDQLDRTSAYLFATRYGLPTGHHSLFAAGNTAMYSWYIATDVSIVRPDGSSVLIPHISSMEIEYYRSIGWFLKVDKGTGWYELTDDSWVFVEKMEELRNTAPDDFVKGKVKQIAVAWAGSKGQKSNRTNLILIEHMGERDEVIWTKRKGELIELPYVVHIRYNPNPSNMPHWWYAIVSQSRVDVQMLADQFRSTLLAVDTDCVYVRPSTLSENYRLKGTFTPKTGDITRTRMYDVTFEKNRWMSWYDENGKYHTKRPGEPIIGREEGRNIG